MLVGALGARQRGDRRELPLRAQGAGRPAPAAGRRALRHDRAPAARGRRRDRLLEPHPRARAGGRGGRGQPPARRAASSSAARSPTATSAGASWASRRPTSCPTRRSRAPGTACTPASRPSAPTVRSERRAGGGQHRRAPDLPDRPRRADRGLPARLRRRPVRADAVPGLPRAPARRAALRHGRGARRADAPRRRADARAAAGERPAPRASGAIEHRPGSTRLLPCPGP